MPIPRNDPCNLLPHCHRPGAFLVDQSLRVYGYILFHYFQSFILQRVWFALPLIGHQVFTYTKQYKSSVFEMVLENSAVMSRDRYDVSCFL